MNSGRSWKFSAGSVVALVARTGGQGSLGPLLAPHSLHYQISRLHLKSIHVYLHGAHQPSQAGLKAFPKEASIFFSSLTIGPSSLLSTLHHQGLRFLLLTQLRSSLCLEYSACSLPPLPHPTGFSSKVPSPEKSPWTNPNSPNSTLDLVFIPVTPECNGTSPHI